MCKIVLKVLSRSDDLLKLVWIDCGSVESRSTSKLFIHATNCMRTTPYA
jgi:hypothetical protein